MNDCASVSTSHFHLKVKISLMTHMFVTQELGNPHFDMVLIRRTSADPAFFTPVDMNKYRKPPSYYNNKSGKSPWSSGNTTCRTSWVERSIIAKHYQKPTMLGCQAGTLTMILSEEGDVRPCEILDSCSWKHT